MKSSQMLGAAFFGSAAIGAAQVGYYETAMGFALSTILFLVVAATLDIKKLLCGRFLEEDNRRTASRRHRILIFNIALERSRVVVAGLEKAETAAKVSEFKRMTACFERLRDLGEAVGSDISDPSHWAEMDQFSLAAESLLGAMECLNREGEVELPETTQWAALKQTFHRFVAAAQPLTRIGF